MAYTKKTWVSGETPLSAENMNHIEQGVADAHNDISSLNTKIQIDSIQLSPYISSNGMIANDEETEVSFSVKPCPDGHRILVVPINLYFCIAYNFTVTNNVCTGFIRNVAGSNHTCGCNVAVIYFK